MRRQFGLARPVRAGGAEHALALRQPRHGYHFACLIRDQRQANLTPAGQLDVDLREQFCIEQRAVAGAVAAIDPVSAT